MQNKVQLITYADRFGGNTISLLTETLRQHFSGVYEGVHILPFFTPFDGADAGFDPVDHTKVDPRLGSQSRFLGIGTIPRCHEERRRQSLCPDVPDLV